MRRGQNVSSRAIWILAKSRAVAVQPQMGRQQDFFGIAPDVGAVRGQHVALAREQIGRPADEVPVLGVAGRDAQGAFLAAAADADRRVGALRSFGFVVGGFELVILAVEVRRLLAEQADEYLAGFLEPVEALLDAAQFDAVGARFFFVPARTDAQLESAVRDDVQRCSHIGQHRGMAEVAVEHERADAQRRGDRRGRRHRRDRAEALVEVVGYEERRVAERFEFAIALLLAGLDQR